MTAKKFGILLTNIGTPDAPTTSAVRRYLKEFLSDPRVVEVPKILWQPFLHCVLLRSRPKQSAELYKKIWTEAGSPLLLYSLQLANGLEQLFSKKLNAEVPVRVGMRYGNPSIKSALEELRAKKVERTLIFPLYPQYSATTTASTFDGVAKTFKKWRHVPEVRMLNNYACDESYIQALSESIRQHWQSHAKHHLLFSFHGIPQRYIDLGDPYADQCHDTAKKVASALKLNNTEWSVAFQSRLGPTKWMTPYTDKVLAELPQKNIKHVQVVCPGFPVDCLETLEEIAIRGKEQFIAAGGTSFEYIPALNNSELHLNALTEIISKVTTDWHF